MHFRLCQQRQVGIKLFAKPIILPKQIWHGRITELYFFIYKYINMSLYLKYYVGNAFLYWDENRKAAQFILVFILYITRKNLPTLHNVYIAINDIRWGNSSQTKQSFIILLMLYLTVFGDYVMGS